MADPASALVPLVDLRRIARPSAPAVPMIRSRQVVAIRGSSQAVDLAKMPANRTRGTAGATHEKPIVLGWERSRPVVALIGMATDP